MSRTISAAILALSLATPALADPDTGLERWSLDHPELTPPRYANWLAKQPRADAHAPAARA